MASPAGESEQKCATPQDRLSQTESSALKGSAARPPKKSEAYWIMDMDRNLVPLPALGCLVNMARGSVVPASQETGAYWLYMMLQPSPKEAHCKFDPEDYEFEDEQRVRE